MRQSSLELKVTQLVKNLKFYGTLVTHYHFHNLPLDLTLNKVNAAQSLRHLVAFKTHFMLFPGKCLGFENSLNPSSFWPTFVCISHFSPCMPTFMLLQLIYLNIICEATDYLTFTIFFSLNYKHYAHNSSSDTLTSVWKWQLNPCLVFKRKRWIAWVCNGSTAVHSLAK
jgi:hypothetical protein